VRILPLDPNAITGHGKPLNPLVVYLRLKVWKQDLGNAIRILLPYARMEAQIDLGRAKADNINELLSSARWFRAGFAGRTVTAGSLLATVRAVRARTLASLRYLESDQCPEMAMARDWLADALYRCAADDPTFLAVALKMSVSPPLSWYTEEGPSAVPYSSPSQAAVPGSCQSVSTQTPQLTFGTPCGSMSLEVKNMPQGLLFTIGHSLHSTERLLELLHDHRVDTLVDVRNYPQSKRNPGANRDVLEGACAASGITYRWFGWGLGGFKRPSLDSYNKAEGYVRRYLREGRRVALMCSEGNPEECHRKALVDRWVRDGLVPSVLHILASGEAVSLPRGDCRIASWEDAPAPAPWGGPEPLPEPVPPAPQQLSLFD